MRRLAGLFSVEHHKAGASVVRPGEGSDRLYVIAQGQVEVLIPDAGLDKRVAILANGDVFSEIALAQEHQPCRAEARALTDTWVLSVARRHVLDLMPQEASVRDMPSASARRVDRESVL